MKTIKQLQVTTQKFTGKCQLSRVIYFNGIMFLSNPNIQNKTYPYGVNLGNCMIDIDCNMLLGQIELCCLNSFWRKRRFKELKMWNKMVDVKFNLDPKINSYALSGKNEFDAFWDTQKKQLLWTFDFENENVEFFKLDENLYIGLENNNFMSFLILNPPGK